MKVLVTGVKGQLGHDVVARLRELGLEAKGVDLEDFDITKEEETRQALAAYGPDAVIHCAAYTAVDKAEEDADTCMRVNRDGTAHIAKACGQLGCKLIYISTDYVFAGAGQAPFEADDPVCPQNTYGKSKLAGERAAQEGTDRLFIVRTSWVFGDQGHNFIRTMLRLGAERDQVTVVVDQVGSPTYCTDLARLLCDMVQTETYGTYHATNEGFCSWYDFARAIMEGAGLSCRVVPVDSSQYKVAAKRPLNSRLSKASLVEAGFALLPPWQDALRRFLEKEALAKQ